MGHYEPKTYRKEGGNTHVIDAGGKLVVKDDGEIDVESGGAFKIAGTAITGSAAQLNAAATAVGVAEALVNAMVAGFAGVTHEAAAPVEVLAANESGDGNRAILIIVKCTDTFTADPTTHVKFQIRNATDGDFAVIGDTGAPATMTEGDIAVFGGELTQEEPVQIVTAEGDATGGAIQVFVIALPAATA